MGYETLGQRRRAKIKKQGLRNYLQKKLESARADAEEEKKMNEEAKTKGMQVQQDQIEKTAHDFAAEFLAMFDKKLDSAIDEDTNLGEMFLNGFLCPMSQDFHADSNGNWSSLDSLEMNKLLHSAVVEKMQELRPEFTFKFSFVRRFPTGNLSDCHSIPGFRVFLNE